MLWSDTHTRMCQLRVPYVYLNVKYITDILNENNRL